MPSKPLDPKFQEFARKIAPFLVNLGKELKQQQIRTKNLQRFSDQLPQAAAEARESIENEGGCNDYTSIRFIRDTARYLTNHLESEFVSDYELLSVARETSILVQCDLGAQLKEYVEANDKFRNGDCEGAIDQALKINDPLLADDIAKRCTDYAKDIAWVRKQRTHILAQAQGDGLTELSKGYFYDESFPYWMQRCSQEEENTPRGKVACLDRVVQAHYGTESFSSTLNPNKLGIYDAKQLQEATTGTLTPSQDCLLQTLLGNVDGTMEYSVKRSGDDGLSWTEYGAEAFYYECLRINGVEE